MITIFSNAGVGGVYAISILTIIKAFYKCQISSLATWFLSVITQVRNHANYVGRYSHHAYKWVSVLLSSFMPFF